MANWVRDFLANNPEVAARQVVKRARHSLHTRRKDGSVEAVFTGAPMHFWDDAEGWTPLDTEPVYDAGSGLWRVRGLDVTVNDDGTVQVGKYAQRTTRVGLFRPATRTLLGTINVPLGAKDGDALRASGSTWEIERRITELGYREWLTLRERPAIGAAKSGDYLVLETQVSGVSLPNGWVADRYNLETHWSPAPVAWDANGKLLPCKRYWRNGVLYTGIPVEELANATYPVVIDPDFTSSTGDGFIQGDSETSYSAARSTSTSYDTGSWGFLYVGQRYYYDVWTAYRAFLKFDTSSIGADATITQVNLRLTVLYDFAYDEFDVQIVKQDWSGQDPLSNANREAAFDGCLSGTADDSIWRNTSGMSSNTPYDSGNLSTAWVSKTGNTYYSLRGSDDKNNNSGADAAHIAFADAANATAAYRPILVVTLDEGSSSHDLTATGVTAGSPSLGAPALGQTHGLTATGVTSGAPSVPTATLGQLHGLMATGIAAGTPTLGTPALGQKHVLTATGVMAGTPAFDTPALGQTHALTTEDVTTGAPSIASPTLGQVHAVTATGVTAGAPTVGTPAIGQAHALTATGVATDAPTAGTPVLGQAHALTTDGVTAGTPDLDAPAIGQTHALTADAVAAGTPTLGEPTLGQAHALSAVSVTTGTPTVETPALGQSHALATEGVTAGTPVLGTPTLGEVHVLQAAPVVTAAPIVAAAILAQVHVLQIADVVTGAPEVGAPLLRHIIPAPSLTPPLLATYTDVRAAATYTEVAAGATYDDVGGYQASYVSVAARGS